MFRVVKSSIDYDRGEFNWIATDEDGLCYIYKEKPEIRDFEWYSSQGTNNNRFVDEVKCEGDWRESLMSLDEISIEDYLKGE